MSKKKPILKCGFALRRAEKRYVKEMLGKENAITLDNDR